MVSSVCLVNGPHFRVIDKDQNSLAHAVLYQSLHLPEKPLSLEHEQGDIVVFKNSIYLYQLCPYN